MIQKLTIVIIALFIPFLIFNLMAQMYEQLRIMKEQPILDPSWIATLLSLIEAKSITIDKFCTDYKIEREDF